MYTLFVISLVYTEITNSIAIWNRFDKYFCEDLSYQLQDWQNIPKDLTNPYYDYSLYFVSQLLKKAKKTFKQYGLFFLNCT